MRKLLAAGTVLMVVAAGMLTCSSSRGSIEFAPRMAVGPRDARVFAGNSLQFHTHVVGELDLSDVRWSVVGPGSIDDRGLYRAAEVPSSADVVANAGHGLADSVSVQTVKPPLPDEPLILATCYSDGTVNVNDERSHVFLGALSVGGRAAGITVDPGADRAVFVVESQMVAIDLRTMHWQVSTPISGVRLSEVTRLAFGFYGATDNNADAGQPGVRIYRIDASGMPRLVTSAAAGETPEGIVAEADGRTFYVTNINGNSLMRFSLAPSGRARLLVTGKTAARPFGIALDPVSHELFVADNDTSVVNGARARPGLERFDATTLRRIGPMISTGSGSSLPLGVAVDPPTRRVFVTNEGDQNVVVFALPAMRRIAVLTTGLTPWLPSLDPQSDRLYVPNARDDTISIFDARSLRTITAALPTCSYPTSVTVAHASRGAHS
ncbi:MAG TPA: YncE family protein [Candidatus Acidoferrales bacterium]|nr:YncE family protein [Candidatus Acidoferrales bacterium]